MNREQSYAIEGFINRVFPPDVLQAMKEAEQMSREFEQSMDPRCFRHQHDGNPCMRCMFIRIDEQKPLDKREASK